MKALKASQVEFTVLCEPEDLPIEGNCMASGDPDVDLEAEEWVRSELRSGNEWGWCQITVRAQWEGFIDFASCGACSYRSEKDARELIEELKSEALDALNARI